MAVLGVTMPVRRLHRDATLNLLTGALARSEFERRLDGRLKARQWRERDDRVVVIALDLDGFKAVDDRHGSSSCRTPATA